MKATSPIDGEPSIREIIAALAAGEVIRMDEDGRCELRKPGKPIGRHTLEYHLIRDGWIESTANCGGYVLSDAGRLAYMRSTDELGSGELVPLPRGVIDCDGTSPCSTCPNKRECGKAGCIRIAQRRRAMRADAGSAGNAGVIETSDVAQQARNNTPKDQP